MAEPMTDAQLEFAREEIAEDGSVAVWSGAKWLATVDALRAEILEAESVGAEPTCKTCPFFAPNDYDTSGECRALPPTPHIDSYGDVSALFPGVSGSEWCGKHPGRAPASTATQVRPDLPGPARDQEGE